MRKLPLQEGKYAIVDNEDFDYLNQWHWWDHGTYVVRDERYGKRINNKKYRFLIHRVILGLEKGNKKIVDHINHNPLDNRKCNLRVCTQVENQQNRGIYKNNTSGYKGVYWHKLGKKWMAYITHRGQRIHCGLHKTVEDAHKARMEKEEDLGIVIPA